jgi:hypothetical protein
MAWLALSLSTVTAHAAPLDRYPCQQPGDCDGMVVDPAVEDASVTIRDREGAPQPLATVRDAAGQNSTFIADELIVSAADPDALGRLLNGYGGQVIATDAVPAPPPGSGIQLRPEDAQPTEYVVQVDASSQSLDEFAADAATLGQPGSPRVSSEAGARLLALAVHEMAAGRSVSPNFVSRPDGTVMVRPTSSRCLKEASWATATHSSSRRSWPAAARPA